MPLMSKWLRVASIKDIIEGSAKIIEANERGKLDEYIDRLDRQIEKFGARLDSVQPESLNEEEKALFYNALHRLYPSVMSRISSVGFEASSPVFYILSSLRGEEFYIHDDDIIDMINLSLTIDEKVRRYVSSTHPGDDLWITSFREQVKLHSEFIRAAVEQLPTIP